jgi:hypothetical protein
LSCEEEIAVITHKKSKKELWDSLRGYHFSNLVPIHLTDRVAEMFGGKDASTKAFAHKLSRKLGWPAEFALRAIAEYKKFVFLGVVSTENVTPSKVIDQVWHEHQLFTKAYREFCNEVIDKEFDHTPELIPVPEQTLQFNQQYLDTLALYKAEFNMEPPADIWAVTKFDPQSLPANSAVTNRRRTSRSDGTSRDGTVYQNDPPLYTLVDAPMSDGQHSPSFHGFGGGTSGGAGATDNWGAPVHSHSSHDAGHGGHGGASGHASHGGDSGHASSGDGGSGSGGSSCSSSCGGGGCGGGGCGGS